MRNHIWCLLLFVSGCCLGCGLTDDPDMRELKNSLRITGEEVVAKQDESIVILKENTTALAAIKANIEALQVKSETPKGQEVIQSSESPAKANDTQNPLKVATPGTSSRTASDGTTLRWNIEGDWNPDILETSAHLRTDHGIETNGMTHQEMADIHADLHEGKPVAKVKVVNRGTSCPNGRCPVPQRRGLFGGLFR